mmetsp:Transcript_8935/g.10223  ORF Transcript_8935/g.10223 Transcript_8935/m.10223 type:complete len:577 (+) Transcript_8935:100-1830(+)|eukprot:CAMPEP_0184016522 /NCGR_PEP_ID=MMETSP0954-20121128/6975_1 /TAXON_ID=627963 /ORGANISM="Aplanochytrium sp, Strain PBS07" /LENGTH=576 /DNA_ID=CAMNT_0026297551 /DNA_START=110 /DNA_END=1840 /DNA_ORIENTATION=+
MTVALSSNLGRFVWRRVSKSVTATKYAQYEVGLSSGMPRQVRRPTLRSALSQSASNKDQGSESTLSQTLSLAQLGERSECLASDSKWADTPFSRQVFAVLGLNNFTKDEFEAAFDRADINNDTLLQKDEFRSLVYHASCGRLSETEIEKFTESFWKYHGLTDASITKKQFLSGTETLAKTVDPRVNAISFTFLLTGCSIGVIIPVMPQLAQALSITSSQYGYIIGSFAMAKMIGNIPAATIVDKYGQKSSLVLGLSTIGISIGSVGLAESYEWIILCRFVSGLGVASFSAAAIQYLSDISTPLNRAKTIAPPMTAFSLGTAMGPALGGLMLDHAGFAGTFASVGAGFVALAAANFLLLPRISDTIMCNSATEGGKKETLFDTWKTLLSDKRVSNMMLVNSGYWFVLSGTQMTLLPLLLSGDKFGLSASAVGSIFMGMSMIGVVFTPLAGRLLDSVGRVPMILPACGVIGGAMAATPLVDDIESFVGLVAVWTAAGTLLGAGPTAYITDIVSPSARAQALALLRTVGDVGMLFGAVSAGYYADIMTQQDAMQANGFIFIGLSTFAALRFASISQKIK